MDDSPTREEAELIGPFPWHLRIFAVLLVPLVLYYGVAQHRPIALAALAAIVWALPAIMVNRPDLNRRFRRHLRWIRTVWLWAFVFAQSAVFLP